MKVLKKLTILLAGGTVLLGAKSLVTNAQVVQNNKNYKEITASQEGNNYELEEDYKDMYNCCYGGRGNNTSYRNGMMTNDQNTMMERYWKDSRGL